MSVLASSARVVLLAVSQADCLHKAGDLDGAIEVYQQALALEPDSDYLHFLIAKLFQEKGDLVHALPEYGRGAQLYDEPTREDFASLFEDSGDLVAALAEVKEAIRIWPDNAYFHYLLGRLLVKKNDPDAAIVELQWALKKEYNHFSLANCALGRAFELKGDLQTALGQYRTAFRAHTHNDRCRAAYERLRLQLKK
jgi:tetratricopeptide (TPR) repeat protein